MRDAAKRSLIFAAAVAGVAVAVVLLSGEKQEPGTAPAPDPEPITITDPEGSLGEPGGGRSGGGGKDEPGGNEGGGAKGEEGGGGPSAGERLGRETERTYRAYIRAINARDGRALCRLVAPGFLRELKPPVRRDGCAATIHASIGYEDPRRFPVWEETVLTGFESIRVRAAAGQAQVTAGVITRFADRTEPSVESDIAYLGRDGGANGGRLRLLKASGVLWRAVGKPDYPPSVISPP